MNNSLKNKIRIQIYIKITEHIRVFRLGLYMQTEKHILYDYFEKITMRGDKQTMIRIIINFQHW